MAPRERRQEQGKSERVRGTRERERERGRRRKREKEIGGSVEGEGEERQSREGGGQGGGEGGDAEDRRSLHCRRTDPTHVRIPVGRTDAAVGSPRNRGTRCTGTRVTEWTLFVHPSQCPARTTTENSIVLS